MFNREMGWRDQADDNCNPEARISQWKTAIKQTFCRLGKDETACPNCIQVCHNDGGTGLDIASDIIWRKKLHGEPFETETVQPKNYTVTSAHRVKNLRTARIALVTDGELVPLISYFEKLGNT